MFSYYGSKSKIAHLYPAPQHGTIIEPFAGSARYALRYFERDVVLIDKFHKIVEIWKYLQQASEQDVLSLPDVGYKQSIPASLSDAEKWLIGYCVNRGSSRPATQGAKFNNWSENRKEIAASLFKIRHWQIKLGDYSDAPDISATWFIDPPYFQGGHKYNRSNKDLNFSELSAWATRRKGQVIVCENTAATWMPFIYLKTQQGAFNRTDEAFWTNQTIETQVSLF